MSRPRSATLAFLTLMASPSIAASQVPAPATIVVEVYDVLDDRPIEAALVGIPELSRFVLTDSSGNAVLRQLPGGDHRLEVVVLGYGRAIDTLHVEGGESGRLRVGMNVQPFEIKGITVDGRFRWSSSLERSGFYARSRSGVGRFFDRNDMQDRLGRWSTLGQALQGRPLGLCRTGVDGGIRGDRGASSFDETASVRPRRGSGGIGTGGRQESAATESLVQSGGGGGPVIFVDGLVWSGTLDEVRYDLVDGIEIYRSSPNLPVQYSGMGLAPCGVVLVWMRR